MVDSGANMDPGSLFSIGEVGETTGLSPHTIRVWERRYGKPQAVRLASGHRRYTQEQVVWLRCVAEALANGHRPGKVLKLEGEELEQLTQRQPGSDLGPLVGQLMDMVYASDSVSLAEELKRCWHNRGARTTIFDAVVPLIHEVGRAWQEDRLTIAQEHQLTEVLQDLLRGFRGQVSATDRNIAESDRVILATLAGERHGLGLQLVALLVALYEREPVLLGVDLPVDEIVRVSKEVPRSPVAISVSTASGGPATDRVISSLRRELHPKTTLLIGGSGARRARRGVRDVVYLPTLAELELWMQSEYGIRPFDQQD
ncbi:MAG: MerR family transcriptional regulator [Planctomycetes bacterium]|nr:MerR family transcriptional regulator [Planctomycetota bacterium]